jgi:hypothetical protein
MAPIKGRTNKGELVQPHVTHQTVQMDAMAAIILEISNRLFRLMEKRD